ncbi:MAG: hypothetical protein ACTSX7_06850 [Alphaproteobacteria bacterium]
MEQERNAVLRKDLLHRLQSAAHRKFPNCVPDPDRQERLAAYRRGDLEKNASSEPPADELVDLCCIWAVEFYTPAHIDGLLAGFASLGWDRDEESSLTGHNPAEWVRWHRQSSQGGGEFNLGKIRPPGQISQSTVDRRAAPLPECAEFALGSLFAVTSSITCIVLGFALTKEAGRRFDKALRRTHETYMEPQKRGHEIVGPARQKERAISLIRGELRDAASDWFREYLPGLFSSGETGDDFPTCELT